MGAVETVRDFNRFYTRALGYRKIKLWTKHVLRPAHRVYHAAGFRLAEEFPEPAFGQDLKGSSGCSIWSRRRNRREGSLTIGFIGLGVMGQPMALT